MPNYNPANMAYMLRASESSGRQIDPNLIPQINEFSVPNLANGQTQMPPNFVPPNMSGLPRLRQGDKEILENFGITPEELFNIQAQLRKDNATR